jgi:hypothetical protein
MRRRLRSVRAFSALVLLVLTFVLLMSGIAAAQTTTVPTTTAPTTTTSVSSTTSTSTAGGTPTTLAPIATEEGDDSGSDIPWVPIAIGAAAVIVLILLLLLWALRRGARKQAVADWRARAADSTAEAGAVARLLSGGTPPSAPVVQQVLASLRAFEDLEATAPDSAARASAERGRRVVQSLGRAIDSDYTVRRAEPPAPPERVDGSAAMLRSTAAETDRALRALYRGFTETSNGPTPTGS